jgi:hypothetical protein
MLGRRRLRRRRRAEVALIGFVGGKPALVVQRESGGDDDDAPRLRRCCRRRAHKVELVWIMKNRFIQQERGWIVDSKGWRRTRTTRNRGYEPTAACSWWKDAVG